jgi:hypothetical protein
MSQFTHKTMNQDHAASQLWHCDLCAWQVQAGGRMAYGSNLPRQGRPLRNEELMSGAAKWTVKGATQTPGCPNKEAETL